MKKKLLFLITVSITANFIYGQQTPTTNSKLTFSYDTAGNQTQRFYCPEANCLITSKMASNKSKVLNDVKNDVVEALESLEDANSIQDFTLFPNPTKGMVSLKLYANSNVTLAHQINIYNAAGVLVKSQPSQNKNHADIDLSNVEMGMYLVHIHLSNGESITKQIIKN